MNQITRLFVSFVTLSLASLATSAQTKVDSREIIDRVNKGEPVAYRNAQIVGDLDLTQLKNQGVRGKDNTSQTFHVSLVEVPFLFTDCTFTGDIITTRQPEQANIYVTNFTREAKFQNCTFKGAGAFRHALFSDKITFDGSQFEQKADFMHAVFSTRPTFKRAIFTDEVNFRHTEFDKGVDFAKATFEQAIDFRHTGFADDVSFEQATFTKQADFSHAEFSTRAQWSGVSFRQGVGAEHTQLNGRQYDLRSDLKADR